MPARAIKRSAAQNYTTNTVNAEPLSFGGDTGVGASMPLTSPTTMRSEIESGARLLGPTAALPGAANLDVTATSNNTTTTTVLGGAAPARRERP